MERVVEDLAKQLADEERQALHIMVANGKFALDEVNAVLTKTERLTSVVDLGGSFDFSNISALGLSNCCEFFKGLCEQYVTLKSNDIDGAYLARQHRIVIDHGFYPSRPIDIGLYDAAEKLDRAISGKYTRLKSGAMRADNNEAIYRYAQFDTFASMYYQLRDCIEGKSYYDGQFMTTYRELSNEYAELSNNLLLEAAHLNGSAIDETRTSMIETLNQGIDSLVQLSQVEKFEQQYGVNEPSRGDIQDSVTKSWQNSRDYATVAVPSQVNPQDDVAKFAVSDIDGMFDTSREIPQNTSYGYSVK